MVAFMYLLNKIKRKIITGKVRLLPVVVGFVIPFT